MRIAIYDIADAEKIHIGSPYRVVVSSSDDTPEAVAKAYKIIHNELKKKDK